VGRKLVWRGVCRLEPHGGEVDELVGQTVTWQK